MTDVTVIGAGKFAREVARYAEDSGFGVERYLAVEGRRSTRRTEPGPSSPHTRRARAPRSSSPCPARSSGAR
ncbi:hypothetical protein ACFQ3Z_42425 [Streptomyces nogalater]